MKIINWLFLFRNLATDIPFEEIVDEIKDFDERFGIILKKHLAILAWWCIINLIVGVPFLLVYDGWWLYFFVMNISWAVINFLIVLFLYDHIFFLRFQKGNVFQRFEVQRHVQRMLLLNIGLDTAYIFAGLYLKTLAAIPDIAHPALWYGFGWSVIVQGAFLFIHDNVFHYYHLKNFRKCKPFLERAIKLKLRETNTKSLSL
jgi:hypothetical protein